MLVFLVVAMASFLLGWETHMIWTKWRAGAVAQSTPAPSPEAMAAVASIKQSHQQLTTEAPQLRELARSTYRRSDTRANRIEVLKAERRVLDRQLDGAEVT